MTRRLLRVGENVRVRRAHGACRSEFPRGTGLRVDSLSGRERVNGEECERGKCERDKRCGEDTCATGGKKH
jgi:hypothetical protein